MKLPYNLKLGQSADKLAKDLTTYGFEYEGDFSTLYSSFDWPNAPAILDEADIVIMLETEGESVEELSLMIFPDDESYDADDENVLALIRKDQAEIFAYFSTLYGTPIREGEANDEGMDLKTAYKAWKVEELFVSVAMDIIEADDLEDGVDPDYVVSLTFSTHDVLDNASDEDDE